MDAAQKRKMDMAWIRRQLPKAVLLALVLALVSMALFTAHLRTQVRLSHEYWTREAGPFRVVEQERPAGAQTLIIQLNNSANQSLFLDEVWVEGGPFGADFNLGPGRAEFMPGEDKILLIPINQTCAANQSYRYELSMAYARERYTLEKELQEGKYPIFGVCR